jgi:hypothetical protein
MILRATFFSVFLFIFISCAEEKPYLYDEAPITPALKGCEKYIIYPRSHLDEEFDRFRLSFSLHILWGNHHQSLHFFDGKLTQQTLSSFETLLLQGSSPNVSQHTSGNGWCARGQLEGNACLEALWDQPACWLKEPTDER